MGRGGVCDYARSAGANALTPERLRAIRAETATEDATNPCRPSQQNGRGWREADPVARSATAAARKACVQFLLNAARNACRGERIVSITAVGS